MLNDYRIFDYRIKCSFSFLFVSHSILEILRSLLENATLARSDSVVCSLPAAALDAPRNSACPGSPTPIRPARHCCILPHSPSCTSVARPQHGTTTAHRPVTGRPSHATLVVDLTSLNPESCMRTLNAIQVCQVQLI